METKFFKKVGLVFLSLVFSLVSTIQLLPAQNVSATTNEAEEKLSDEQSSELWQQLSGELADKNHAYCPEGVDSFLFGFCTSEKPQLLSSSSDRYVNITMHVKAGEGHFEEGESQTRTNTYYRGDAFDDHTMPVSDREDYVFVGWSTSEEATVANVEVGETTAAAIGTDLWAVWSDKAYVAYYINGGAWEAPDGEQYSYVMMEYDVNDTFRPLAPDPYRIENRYDFVGWTTQNFGRGERYTSETPIGQYYTEVYAEWKYNPTKVEDEMFVDEEYAVTAGVSIPVYKFTPEEDGWYEIYTDGVEAEPSDSREAMLRLLDEGDHTLKHEQYIDPMTGGDVHVYYEMEAGETYYIRFGEMSGAFISFNAGVRRASTTTVTFDVNHEDVWFNIDETQSSTKDVVIPIGDDIAYRSFEDFQIGDDSILFSAWATEPDGEIHSSLLVGEEPMTVYAQYRGMVAILLDYNGGHSPFNDEETSYLAKFNPFDQFETPIDPKTDDATKKFVGWSVNPNATEPDPEVKEGKDSSATLAEWLDGRTLYAVYDEPVSVTFVVTGDAFMLDDQSITTYESSLGRGHIFYGMAVMHACPYVEHAGWIDQNGVFTTATSGIDSTYIVSEDSVFTSVLKYKLLAIGNGGFFPNGGIGGSERINVRLSYNGWRTTFSYDEAIEILGNPVSHEDNMHFVGFATTPNATEPDIIDGETLLEDLDTIYAIWAEDEEQPIPDEGEEGSEEEDVPLVPNTGFNTATPKPATIASCAGAIFIVALIGYLLFHKRRA